MHPAVGVTIADIIARLNFGALQNPEQATKIYDWIDEKYPAHPALARAVPGRAALLNSQGKWKEADALLKANWDTIVGLSVLTHEYSVNGLRAWDTALSQLKRRTELLAPLAQAFSAVPLLLDDRDPDSAWAYETAIEINLQAGRGREALGWARLRFAECPYANANIAKASKLLTDTWQKAEAIKATGGKGAKSDEVPANVVNEATKTEDVKTATDAAPALTGWQAFAAAQSDAAVANPLLDIPLPQLDKELWQTATEAMLAGTAYRHYAITALIAGGYYGDAMKIAEEMAASNPASTVGVLEGCRVFKAAQLNLRGANALIASLQDKEGAAKAANPLPAFYKQHPPGKYEAVNAD